MRFLRTHWPYICIVCIPFVLFLILFRELLAHVTTALFDWNDYPLYIWIMFQNIAHLKALSFAHFFDGAIFYPDTHTLLFSDLFLPQSLIAVVLNSFIHNPILVFNIIFISTILANSLTAAYLWSYFEKNKWLLLFSVIVTTICSFIFQNWYHFQIFSLWPLLLALGFFMRPITTWKRAAVGGVVISIVLYASVYYWVFLVTTLPLWYLSQAFFSANWKKQLASFLRLAVITLSVFILLSGVTLYNYWQTRQQYHAIRDYGEYVQYSAQISDYLFPGHMSSLLWGSKLVRKWNQFNQHGGVSPGIVMAVLVITGLFTFRRNKNYNNIAGIEFTQRTVFFLTLCIIGFGFSLGPRLSFNGTYLRLPLPYHFLLKYVPLFEVVRVTSRWSVLFMLGLVYLATQGLKKISSAHQGLIVGTVLIIYLAEVYPLQWHFTSQPYYPDVNNLLASQCTPNSKVLLEYPMTEFKDGATIVTNLTYRTQMMLASIRNHCLLVNGYTGYIPKEYEAYETQLFTALENKQEKQFFDLINERGATLVKLNKHELFPDRVATLSTWLTTQKEFTVLSNNDDYLVAKHND